MVKKNNLIMNRIDKDADRRASFKKRSMGILKKASELSTLCGVDVLAVIIGEDEPETPLIWPPEQDAVQRIIDKFNELPQMEKEKKKDEMGSFLRGGINKLKQQKAKVEREVYKVEMEYKLLEAKSDRECINDLPLEELKDLWEFLQGRTEMAMAQLGVMRRRS